MLKRLFFSILVKPLILLVMGIHVRGSNNFPKDGAYIIAANHNSHLDTLILMTLFPSSVISNISPVAAEDYFFRNRYLKWFALNIIGIIPISRQTKISKINPLQGAIDALQNGKILIIFPEGSRGEAEQMVHFKTGVAHLAKVFPQMAVVPVNIYGAGKSLPRGKALFVPFIADINIGEPLYYGDSESVGLFTQKLEESILSMGTH